ncbi:MAG: phosphoribosylglycinamide formyltransferase [Pseudomonadota bacterium]
MSGVAARRVRTAVLISGRGSNMMALAEAAQDPDYPAEIMLVISNRPCAAGLAKAAAAGIKTAVIDHTAFDGREAFERALDRVLREHGTEFVACAGFMRILTRWFVSRWAGRMINIHPSLLPKYKGLNTHRRALEAGDAQAGASVHWVVPDVDAGTVIAQGAVDIRPGDTEETLRDRVLARELTLYPDALRRAVATL